MKEKIKKLQKYIDKSEKILLLTHTKMDGDAIGSLCTLYRILEKLNKKVKATNDFEVSESFSFLKIGKSFSYDINFKTYSPDLIICLDTGSVEQLGGIYENNKSFFKGKNIIVIDHHKSNTKFGNINIVDKDASSTCEIMFGLIKKLGYGKYIGKKEVNLLLTGIVTDTNIFYNKNTTDKSLDITGKLVGMGGDLNKIIYNLYHKISFEKIQLKGLMYQKIKKSKSGKIIGAILLKKDFDETKTSAEFDTSGLIQDIINIDGCEIAYLIYELGDYIKVSFRAKEYDVGKLSESFPGGGGHKLAAGFKTKDNIEKTEKEILKRIKL